MYKRAVIFFSDSLCSIFGAKIRKHLITIQLTLMLTDETERSIQKHKELRRYEEIIGENTRTHSEDNFQNKKKKHVCTNWYVTFWRVF